jgi:cytochrome c-type biogenesis protein
MVAGVLSFSSPCCLPLMPGYVAYVSGAAAPQGGVAVRRRAVGAGVLFVLGFAIVFTLLGASASTLGSLLLRNRTGLTRVAGVIVIVLGLASTGIFRIPFLQRELRMDLSRVRPGPGGAVPLGMAFAIGWTPCIGPVLAGILAAAASTTDMARGATLMLFYSLGLGIPFLLLALGIGGGGRITAWLRRHGRGIEVAGGLLLVSMGVLMITGVWLRLFTPILRLFSRTGWPPV